MPPNRRLIVVKAATALRIGEVTPGIDAAKSVDTAEVAVQTDYLEALDE